MAEAMKEAGTQGGLSSTGKYEGAADWFNNRTAFRQAADAGRTILDAFDDPDAADLPGFPRLGRRLASGALAAVKRQGPTAGMEERAALIRAMLGEAAVTRMHFDDTEIMNLLRVPGFWPVPVQERRAPPPSEPAGEPTEPAEG
jgi:hypothetical protein